MSDTREPGGRYGLGMRGALWAVAVVASMVASSPGAARAQAPASAPISLADALRLGASAGPDVALAAAPLAASRAARETSRTWLVLPPIVSAGAGPRSDASKLSLDVQASAVLQVPLRDVRGARGDVAHATLDLIGADTRRARFGGALRAGVAWSRAMEAKEVLRLRQDALDQAEAIASTARKRAQSGVSMPSELAVVLGDLGFARASLLDAEGTLVEARAELRLATGAAVDAPVDVAGDLYADASRAPERTPSTKNVEANNPEIRFDHTREAVARGETALTSATLGPNVGVGASFMHEGTGATSVVGVITLPLPIVDHAAFERSRSQAREDVAAAQTQRTRREVASQAAIALHDIEHFRQTRDTLSSDALPPLREAVRLAAVQFAAGTQEIGLVMVSRQRLIAAQEMLARVSGDVVRADLRLAHVTGALLPEAR